MTKKTKTYILLAAVLSIWGLIGYKIIFAVNPSASTVPETQVDVAFKPEQHKVIDTFSIHTAERDPFLGTLLVKKVKKAKVSKAAKVDWIPVQYHGSITKNDKNSKIFIVSINNTQYLMKKGQVIHDVKLVKGNDTGVTMRYKGMVKQIEKL